MARTAAQRRAARKRKDQDRTRRRHTDQTASGSRPPLGLLVDQLVSEAVRAPDDGTVERCAAGLAALDPDGVSDTRITGMLVDGVRTLWENGWQPADLGHVVGRQGTARQNRLATAIIAAEAAAAGATDRAPAEWQAQLSALIGPSRTDAPAVSAWRHAEQLPATEAWRTLLGLVRLLADLGPLQQLAPPPSEWGRRPASRTTASAADSRVLGRIRSLLAKAESTGFAEEAEALSAKAQELMTRHAVDVAVLDAAHGTSIADQVQARRVHIDNPYPEAKVRLLTAVGEPNDVRAIFIERLGIVTIVGLPTDLDSVELLFTSLLVQAGRAMTATGRSGSSRTRSPSFRRGFLLAYGQRIGERLGEARAQATTDAAHASGADLLPVLRSRSQAVDDAFDQMFPETYALGPRSYDLGGWHAGRLAAEHAHLGSGREEVTD